MRCQWTLKQVSMDMQRHAACATPLWPSVWNAPKASPLPLFPPICNRMPNLKAPVACGGCPLLTPAQIAAQQPWVMRPPQ